MDISAMEKRNVKSAILFGMGRTLYFSKQQKSTLCRHWTKTKKQTLNAQNEFCLLSPNLEPNVKKCVQTLVSESFLRWPAMAAKRKA